MRIKSVAFSSLGPFAYPSPIELDKDLTVITGANDSGKSRILRGLELLLTKNQIEAEDINEEKMHELRDGWKQAKPVRADIEIIKTANSEPAGFVIGGIEGDVIKHQYNLHENSKPFHANMVTRYREDGAAEVQKTQVEVKKLPLHFSINTAEMIRREINFDAPNQTERKILNIAFGENFTIQTYRDFGAEPRRRLALTKASDRLTKAFEKYLPYQLKFDFQIIEVSENSLSISVGDQQQCHVESIFRGSGFQRMLSFFAQLVHAHSTGSEQNSRIITIDEPELHLHSDSQRQLRKVIEDAAIKENVQIIYTTHSPCFINAANPPSIRLVKRTNNKGKATSIVENTADLPATRRELGVAISESLALGAVTVIVEGITEYPTLTRLCLLLHSIGKMRREEILDVLGQITVVNGHGDNIINYLSIISNFGVKPVVLLDGDKKNLVKRIHESHPEALTFMLDEGKEYEDLMPLSVYVRQSIAHSHTYDEDVQKPAVSEYEKWLEAKPTAKKHPLSKRMSRFLHDCRCYPGKKQVVFSESLKVIEEQGDIEEGVNIAKITEFFNTIKTAVDQI